MWLSGSAARFAALMKSKFSRLIWKAGVTDTRPMKPQPWLLLTHALGCAPPDWWSTSPLKLPDT